MLRHCAVLIVVIAITCQFYCTNAAYSLFNIYHGLVLSLFAITRLQGHSPGDHAVTALGLRYIHCCSLSQHCFLQMCAIMAGHCKIFTFINIVHYDNFMLLFIVLSFVHHDCVESLSGSFAMITLDHDLLFLLPLLLLSLCNTHFHTVWLSFCLLLMNNANTY